MSKYSMRKNETHEQLVALQRGFFLFGDSASLKILYELDRHGEKTFSHLRDQLSINPATLSKKLKILTQAGILTSDKTHDHLRVYYSIANHHRPIKKLIDAFEKLTNEL